MLLHINSNQKTVYQVNTGGIFILMDAHRRSSAFHSCLVTDGQTIFVVADQSYVSDDPASSMRSREIAISSFAFFFVS